MSRAIVVLLLSALLSPAATAAEPGSAAAPAAAAVPAAVPVAVVINPCNGDRAGPESYGDVEAMLDGGLEDVIGAAGGRLVRADTVALSEADERHPRRHG